MNITLHRENDAVHFEALNAEGQVVHTDGSEAAGGEGKGFRPMELLLVGLGSCSAIDVVLILKRMRQEIDDIKIEVQGARDSDEVPSVFRKIHVHYTLIGQLDPDKVERAINLSMEKYCSATRMLEQMAEITHSFNIEAK
ncbi:MAG: OsmC family protein [Bacteroidota bacterium]